MNMNCGYFHLPGAFEFFEFYNVFIPFFYEHRDWFYDWCNIGSLYGAPGDCLWGGGRIEENEGGDEKEVFELCRKYKISLRLAFSNCLLREKHLSDRKCNKLCSQLNQKENGVIVASDLLLDYIGKNYPEMYFVSSTTKVLTRWDDFYAELKKSEYKYVVPDFRLNKRMEELNNLDCELKNKVEFLCNECCWTGCKVRKECYESVSREILGEGTQKWSCPSPYGNEGYVFSRAMESPVFIKVDEIEKIYLPAGFSNFKIEGRGLGSALLLEFLLYYMTKPEFHLKVREKLYLNNRLDLF